MKQRGYNYIYRNMNKINRIRYIFIITVRHYRHMGYYSKCKFFLSRGFQVKIQINYHLKIKLIYYCYTIILFRVIPFTHLFHVFYNLI